MIRGQASGSLASVFRHGLGSVAEAGLVKLRLGVKADDKAVGFGAIFSFDAVLRVGTTPGTGGDDDQFVHARRRR